MPPKSNPALECSGSIQDRYENAQKRFSPLRATLEQPDLPPRGKLLVAVHWSFALGIAPLAYFKASWEAYSSFVLCTLVIALLINQTREPCRGKDRIWTRSSKPRPGRSHKGKFRGPP